MELLKKMRGTALALAFIMSTGVTAMAAVSYNDIAENHWAYTAVTTVAEKGIIVGDGVNYNPTQVIDKFEASKILARVSGYSIMSGYTPQENTTYVINQLKQQLPKTWGTFNKDTENSISYLYENKILTVDNLTKLASKYSDGSESINNLTKEEMAVFLVKALGVADEAQNYKSDYKFSDDSSISSEAKPYVYYLYSQKVISGDNENKFNPTNSITKVEMATLLYKALYDDTPVVKKNDESNEEKPTVSVNVSSFEGEISRIYSSNIMSVELSDGEAKICKVKDDVLVYLNGEVSTIDKLKEGMDVVVITIDSEVSEIRATGEVKKEETTDKETENKDAEKVDVSSIAGKSYVVEYVKKSGNTNIIGVEVKTVSPLGDIEAEIQDFVIADGCILKKGSKDIELSDISSDDVVTIKVYNGKAYYIEIQEKNVIIKDAVLIDKKLNNSDIPLITIKTKEGVEYELKVVATSELRRQNEGEIRWRELRIGDILEIEMEYNNIVSLYAEGSYSEISGWVEGVNISEEYSTILIRDNYGITKEYRVSRAKLLYGIKLNSKITAVLAGQEVEAITVIKEENNNEIYGTIDMAKSSYMYVEKNSTSSVRIDFDANTKVYDAVSGKNVKVTDLTDSMYVMVTFTNPYDDVAQKITILGK